MRPRVQTDSAKLDDLRRFVDEAVEGAMVRQTPLAETLALVLTEAARVSGAECMYMRTYGESLALAEFRGPVDTCLPTAVREAVLQWDAGNFGGAETLRVGERTAFVRRIDVAGTSFGVAVLCFPTAAPSADRTPDSATEGPTEGCFATAVLETVTELLDNHLYGIWAARERNTIMLRLGEALRHRVLRDGLVEAVRILCDAVPIERLLLVYVAEENVTQTLQIRLFEKGHLVLDVLCAESDDYPLRHEALDFLNGVSTKFVDSLGLTSDQEEVLINGITKSVVVGKIVFTTKHSGLNIFNRDLLSGFAGFIRQRVVDFNKEWRTLATSFSPDTVARLVSSNDYESEVLSPREAVVGILYVDISGFTKISETILKSPSSVAHFVESWSEDAVRLVWEHGGVFDKMVGDCVIALFGPPFFEAPEEERLAAALRCAAAIRRMTNAFPERREFAHLAEEGVAVSTGVHLAPLYVGTFGRNRNYTGFSSGMNNTARLQGCAARNEILVMESAVQRLTGAPEFRFGALRHANVKNVAAPLEFRPLEEIRG